VICGQFDGCGNGQGDVAMLVCAGERGIDLNWRAKASIVRAGRGGADERHVRHGADSAYAKLGCDFAENLVGFRMLREGDQGSVAAQDAGLFAGDGGDGGAEPFGVVERDVGDDGESGSTMLVASRRPPMPTSRTAMSTCDSAK
jgi:hypothetical protein